MFGFIQTPGISQVIRSRFIEDIQKNKRDNCIHLNKKNKLEPVKTGQTYLYIVEKREKQS